MGRLRPDSLDPDAPRMPSRLEYGVLLPQHFNGGEAVPTDLRDQIERLMLDRFHGFTVVRGLDGAWLDADRQRYDDRNDEYRLATSDEPALLAWAVDVGRLLEQVSVYVRCPDGRAVILPTADASSAPAPCSHVAHYVVPPETVINLLRLPKRHGADGTLILHYSYFDEEHRVIRIVLAAEPLPNDLASAAGGAAVVGLTGTCVEILAADEGEVTRVTAFLAEKLHQFEREPKE